MPNTAHEAAQRLLPLIDLTLLGDTDTAEDVDRLCAAATTAHGHVAAVCVWPRFVAQAVTNLAETAIGVAAVANFPDGDDDERRAVVDAIAIVADGGNEVDVVFPWRSLAGGQVGVGTALVEATREAVGDHTILKVILETGELDDAALIRAAAFEALDGGADFLKTSTGKTPRSASVEAAEVLLHALVDHDRTAGLKVSGGVRTVAQATPYLDLADSIMGAYWARPSTLRFGASSLLDDVVRILTQPEAV